MAKLPLLIIAILSCILAHAYTVHCTTTDSICKRRDPCVCELSDNHLIDLTALISAENGAQFVDVQKDNYTYYFHGCHDALFDSNKHTILLNQTFNTSLIRYDAEHNVLTNLGDSSQIIYYAAPDNPNYSYEIIYRNGSSNVTASIRLICDNFNKVFLNVVDAATNALTLSSPEVCIKTRPPASLSNGSILLILFIVASLIYTIGGGLILYFFRGARGIELIPNIDFWRNLPGLVKDGVIFLFSGCRTGNISLTETYDRI